MQILKRKDGKRAVFLPAFDDGAPSQCKRHPECAGRLLPGLRFAFGLR